MKKILFFLGVLILGTVGAETAQAMPADEVVGQQEQPSGETFELQEKGDENFSYYTNKEGEILTRGRDNYWYYATTIDNNKKISDGIDSSTRKYLIDTKPSNVLTEKSIKLDLPIEIYDEEDFKTGTNRKIGNKEHNLLVILLEYNDVKIKYSDENWSNLIFSDSEQTLRDYYDIQTNGNIDIVPAKENYSLKNDGVIKVSINKNHPDYNPNDTVIEKSKKRASTSQEAIVAADNYIDYSQYDTNNNGKIEASELHIMVIVAGEEASKGLHEGVVRKYPSVWGVRGGLNSIGGDYRVDLDKVTLRYYTQFGEQHYQSKTNDKYIHSQATLGIIAHEFGHDLGLPDLYNTGYTDENNVARKEGIGLGYTSAMASGSWGNLPGEYSGTMPVGLDAYSKTQLGVAVEEVTDSVQNQLVQSQASGIPTILKVPSEDPKQYFLIENRQFEGYDRGMQRENMEVYGSVAIHSGGISVYRIDTRYENNSTLGKQLVTILDASGKDSYAIGKIANVDPFYYIGKSIDLTDQQTELSNYTEPSSKPYEYEEFSYENYGFGTQSSFYMTVNSKPGNSMYLNLTNFANKLASGYFSEEYDSTNNWVDYPETHGLDRLKFKSFYLSDYATTLSGLEYATNLEYLRAGGYHLGEIQDYSALESLKKLKYLEIHSYRSFSEDVELLRKLSEPVDVSFLSEMTQLEHLGFAPRPVIDLTPLNKLNKLSNINIMDNSRGYSIEHAVQEKAVEISKETQEFRFTNPVKYSKHFIDSEVDVTSKFYTQSDTEEGDEIYDSSIENGVVTISQVPIDATEISLYIEANSNNGNYAHNVTFRVPLNWR